MKLCIGQWHLSPLKVGYISGQNCINITLGPHTVFPVTISCTCHIFLKLIDSLKSLPFQRWFQFWEKPEVTGSQIWAIGGLSHLGDLIFWQKLCTRSDARAGTLLWWSCQSPVAHSCSLLNHLNSFRKECSSLMQNLMQTHCSTHSVILNTMATQYTCSLNGVYHPHWIVQWVVIVHTCAFQSTLLGCQVTSMLHKLFSSY